MSLYVDRDSIYRYEGRPTIAQQLPGQEPQMQFGRAMEPLGATPDSSDCECTERYT